MDEPLVSSNGKKETWLSPVGMLCVFCCMNMLVYIDRGVISSNGVNGAASVDGNPGYGIQGDFGLTLTQDGLLPAAFMVGLLVSSPLFAEASKHYNAFRLIAAGLGIWTLATAGCGFSIGFRSLLLCRMAVGVGEASFVALASPFIDDNAPPAAKTRWLAAFYLCIPVGYAMGYIFGGEVAGPLGWRAPFLLEAGAMSPFVIFCCIAPAIDLKGKEPAPWEAAESGGKSGPLREFGRDLAVLARHPIYVLTLCGTSVYTGVIGAYAYLGPKAGRDTFGIDGRTADLVFGAVTVLTGVLGVVSGGIILDRIGSTIRNALLLCSAGTLLGCVAVALAFGFAGKLSVFIAPFAAGELALFAIQAPSNAIILWSVPPRLRPFAMSIQIVVIHVLGDVPSPVLLGWIQDRLGNWRLSMNICSWLLVAAAVFYAIGRHVASQQPDYRDGNATFVEEGYEGPQSPLAHVQEPNDLDAF